MFKQVTIALALGAGGARGLAHIGVIKALERAGVKISYLAGSSIGALIGAGYAVSGNAAELEKRALEFLVSDVFNSSGLPTMSSVFREKPQSWSQSMEIWLKRMYLQARLVAANSVLDSQIYRKMIDYFVPKVRIEDLLLPFWAMGTELRSGRAVVFKGGPLQAAIYASTAIPGVVHPLVLDEILVVDGGVLNMVPVIPARHMGADIVLAVDVERTLDEAEDFSSALDILFRVEELQNRDLRQMHLRQADLVLRPRVGHIHWSDFQRAAEMIQLGQDEVDCQLDEILALTRRRRIFRGLFRRSPPKPAHEWIVV